MDRDEINKHGGSAFPIRIPGLADNGWDGISLWDWYAGQALAGLCTITIDAGDLDPNVLRARFAANIADAMMAERERRNTNA